MKFYEAVIFFRLPDDFDGSEEDARELMSEYNRAEPDPCRVQGSSNGNGWSGTVESLWKTFLGGVKRAKRIAIADAVMEHKDDKEAIQAAAKNSKKEREND